MKLGRSDRCLVLGDSGKATVSGSSPLFHPLLSSVTLVRCPPCNSDFSDFIPPARVNKGAVDPPNPSYNNNHRLHSLLGIRVELQEWEDLP